MIAEWINQLTKRIESNLEDRSLGWPDLDSDTQQEIRDEISYEIARSICDHVSNAVRDYLEIP